jgi:hypothetical protein
MANATVDIMIGIFRDINDALAPFRRVQEAHEMVVKFSEVHKAIAKNGDAHEPAGELSEPTMSIGEWAQMFEEIGVGDVGTAFDAWEAEKHKLDEFQSQTGATLKGVEQIRIAEEKHSSNHLGSMEQWMSVATKVAKFTHEQKDFRNTTSAAWRTASSPTSSMTRRQKHRTSGCRCSRISGSR